MLNQYLITALWSTVDDAGEPLDDRYSTSDFTEDAEHDAIADCREFRDLLKDTFCEGYDNLWEAALSYGNDEQIGHDFWLTRNGHGAGFWDGDYGDHGDLISCIVDDNFAGLDIVECANGCVEFG